MMIDERLRFSTAQALIATAVSTNTIDFGHTQAMGPGEQLWLVVQHKVAATGTFKVQVQTAATQAFSPVTTVQESETVTAAPAGTRMVIPLGHKNGRAMRLNYVIAEGGATVDAWLTSLEPAYNATFPDALDRP